MKTLVQYYTFTPASRQVTITKLSSVSLEQILLITNVTTNTIIYNFADPSLGAIVAGNVITLDYDTTSMNASDDLQIFIDYVDAGASALNDVLMCGLGEIVRQLQSMRNDGGMADSAGRVRVAIETGSVGIATNQTLATLTTLSNMASAGGYYLNPMVMTLSNAGPQNLRSKISFY